MKHDKNKVRHKPAARRAKQSASSSSDDDRSTSSDSNSSSGSEGDGGHLGPRKKPRTAGAVGTATATAPVALGGSTAPVSCTGASGAAATATPLRPSSPGPARGAARDAARASSPVAGPSTAADKAAAKRARADALMARLTSKLEAATKPKKRLAIQAKMLRLLPKCTPQAAQPPSGASQAAGASASASARVTGAGAGAGAGAAAAGALGPAGSVSGAGGSAGFQFKLQRTPKAAVMLPPGARPSGPEEEARRRLRQQRFTGGGGGAGPEEEEGGQQADAALVGSEGGLGTCEALEKEYLRLTGLPRAADVRPPPVLAAALRLVKAKWLQRPDYAAAAEQLKAIRQDLTVQHVRDGLTVDVYETHGRLALEADDLAEFRRCHAVLRGLYAEGLPGNPAEFEAYGLLYTQATAAARNTLSLELGRVPEHLLGHPFVRHALDVCAAARSGNYSRFIALYDGAPRMSPYIMDRLLGQMRLLALQSTVVACRPLAVPLDHLAAQLGVETEEEAAALATQLGAVVDLGGRCLDTRASAAQPLGPPRPAPQTGPP